MKYNRISTKFWTDEKVLKWDNETRLLALYLLTCSHKTTEGLFRLPKQYICADLEWSLEGLAKPFAKLLEDEFIMYDEEVKVILINNALKYQSPDNPNQEKAAISLIKELPETELLYEFIRQAERFSERFYQRLVEQFGKPLALSLSLTPTPTLSLTLSNNKKRLDSENQQLSPNEKTDSKLEKNLNDLAEKESRANGKSDQNHATDSDQHPEEKTNSKNQNNSSTEIISSPEKKIEADQEIATAAADNAKSISKTTNNSDSADNSAENNQADSLGKKTVLTEKSSVSKKTETDGEKTVTKTTVPTASESHDSNQPENTSPKANNFSDSTKNYQEKTSQQNKSFQQPKSNRKSANTKPSIIEFDRHSKAYQASCFLIDRIIDNNPRSRVPNKDPTSNLMQKWCRELDRLHRLGPVGAKENQNKGYSWPEIWQLINWSQQHHFWKANILSAATLRKQVIKLENQMTRSPTKQKQGRMELLKEVYLDAQDDDSKGGFDVL